MPPTGKRIHIVGCAARSGTTLMAELMINGFEIDGYAAHEMSIFERPVQSFQIFCSKHPGEVDVMRPLLAVDRNLWVIYLQRDPRDVVVSRHHQNPGQYFTPLGRWRRHERAARRLAGHERFIMVQYEDLVSAPDAIQLRLMQRIPFLVKRVKFSEYHLVARPSELSQEALLGVRPISASSVGAWRKHKPRLAAQLERFGPITSDLIRLGYERNDSWLEELDGVEPAHFDSHLADKRPLRVQWRKSAYRAKGIVRYALGAR